MAITKEEIQELIYDPALIQKRQLDLLANSVGGEYTITDPTSPFNMLLEAANATAAAALTEANNIIRKKYPSLANSKDDLYHHLYDNQLDNIFAIPAEVNIYMYVNIVDMINNGYRPTNANYIETMIPKYTKVEILDIPLMIMNDIYVKYYDNGSIYVETQLNNENSLAFNDVGSLEARQYNSSDDTPWIYFEVPVKQLNMIKASKTVVVSDGFEHTVTIEDLYCSTVVSYTNNGATKYLTPNYNDEYIDPVTPKVYISPYDTNIFIRIPDVYLNETSVAGTVNMYVFTTKGKLYIPINKYTTSDFTVTLGDLSGTPSGASIKNITLLANSTATIDGGVNNTTDLELREIIMNNINNVDLPVTAQQLSRAANIMGYKIININDVVTGRLFLALRSLPNMNSSLIMAKQDVYFNTCKLILADLEETDQVVKKGSTFIIKSNTIFKEVNGIVTIATNDQLKYLNNLSAVRLIEHLETNKYFYNPFYYVIETSETYTNSRVYDLDKPDISNIRIVNKNLTVEPRVNINRFDLSKVSTGYELSLDLAPNTEFSNLDPKSIKLQLCLPLFGGTSVAYFDSVYYEDMEIFKFFINTDLVIDSDDYLTLTNGSSNLYTKKFALDVDATVYIMSDDPSVTDDSLFMYNEIYNPKGEKFTVFSKEILTINFGTKLKYIYNKLYSVYGERKYKTYKFDYPLVYTEDVYELDPITGCPFECNEDEYDHEVKFRVLHNKGEPVLDENQQPMYKFRKGDTVLDENGNPIIDEEAGIIRYIDICLLEYEYMVANTPAYRNYKTLTVENLKEYIVHDMETLSGKLLENTEILYKSYKTCSDVGIVVNNVYEMIPYIVTPNVTLYLSGTGTLTSLELEDYKTTIGNIISKYLDLTTIKLEEIRQEIKTELGSTISGVKIEGLDPNNSEVITIKNENIKLTLNKVLFLNTNSEFIVKYNIKLTCQYL